MRRWKMTAMPLQTLTKDAGACCAPGCCDDANAVENTISSVASVIAGKPALAPTIVTPAVTASELTETVRERYGAAARRVMEGVTEAKSVAASCCGPVSSCCGGAAFDGTTDPITSNLYVMGETAELPE